jgi:flagellar hook-associated protein 3 FlgL
MARISTYGASQAALTNLMRAQNTLFDAQAALTTGKKATDLKGVGHQAETLLAARSALARSEAYEEAGVRVEARLEAQNIALERLAGAATDLRQTVTSTDGTFIMDQVNDAFYQAYNALTAQHAGSFVFGGTRADVNPMTVNSLAGLQTLPTAADAFQNNDRRPQVQLDQNIQVDVGMLADTVGTELMQSFKRIADFNAGVNGPISQPMTDVQEAFIRTELPLIITAMENLNATVGQNGSDQGRVETMLKSHSDRQVFLSEMLGDLEDVDMAVAATNFQQAQTAIEVSARTFSSLSQVSLLPFLR